MASLLSLFTIVLATCSISLIYASAITPSELDVSRIEDRQFFSALILLFYGAGVITGKHIQLLRDHERYKPGLGNAPGSGCYGSGSWSFQAPINDVAEAACQRLTNSALFWQQTGDRSKANPYVVVSAWTNGTLLTNEFGFRQTLEFGLVDENGDRGRPFYGVDACMAAITTILYDCAGQHSDTEGGLFFYGHDGVVAYSVDPTCVDSPGKTCGSHT